MWAARTIYASRPRPVSGNYETVDDVVE